MAADLLSESGKHHIRTLRAHLETLITEITHILFFWIPDDEGKGEALRAFHCCLPLIVLMAFFLVSNINPLRIIIFVVVCLVVASQWLFNGCLLTRVERQLTKKQSTVIDLFIKATGSEINRDTLMVASLSSGFTVIGLMIFSIAGEFIQRMHKA